ncbi:MAG: CHAD domain-containing protein [Phycisphaerales bacterium]|jgi:CHAD domain-containing protein|nr:CHAD domain-containing protein [Phycisphaerales bacterium]
MENTGRCSRTCVHELRRACRTAEAAAWLLSSADRSAFERFRTKLKRLRRRAGSVRDVDVARLVLKSLEGSSAIRRDVSLVRESLREKRLERGERLLAFLLKHPRGGVERAARTLLKLSKSLGNASVLRSLRGLDARVRRLAAKGPRSIDAIHTLRIAGKRALLAGDIIRPMPRESNPLAALVDQIGRLLDLEVAIELTKELASEPSPERVTMREGVRRTKRATKRASSGSAPHATGPVPLLGVLRRLARVEKSRSITLGELFSRTPRSRS